MKRTVLQLMCAVSIGIAGLAVPMAGQARTATKPAPKAPAAAAPASKAAAHAPAAARTERPVPFRMGEVLVYDVSWSSYVTAGTATVTVREKKPSYGSTAYYIVAEGRPTPLLSKLYTLYYKADTLLDAYTLLPHRGTVYSDEGGRRRTKVTQFNQAARTAAYQVQTATLVKKDLALQPFTQDVLSAIFVLRALALKQGSRIVVPVSDSGTTYAVTLSVGAAAAMRKGTGILKAWRITPTIVDARGKPTTTREMAIWISDDARRLPVKMTAEAAMGSFNITLREATPGR